MTAGKTNERLARMTIDESAHIERWMRDRGVRFQPALGGTLSLGRTNPFFLGGGKALLNALYARAETLGVRIHYDTEVKSLELADCHVSAAHLVHRGFDTTIRIRGLVAAAGGFQANLDWLEEAWGPAAPELHRGAVRAMPRARCCASCWITEWPPWPRADQCHAIALDARAPKFDAGIVSRVDSVPFSIMVNRHAERFYDEGEDFWPKRYAIWGRLIAKQPDQIAYSIVDAKALELFMPSLFPPEQSDTIAGLAEKLGLDAQALTRTVSDYNAACTGGDFDTKVHDGCRTQGLTPDKSNWARPIDQPPFYAWPMVPGITFTYMGVTVDETARVHMADGRPAANVWAAGEIMAGNVLGQGYLAGIGITIGAVFGRKAGEAAAETLRN